MDKDKVVAFPTSELPPNLMGIEPRPPGVRMFCQHESVMLNEHDRLVNCVQCGAALDSFNFLLNNARTIQMAWHNYRDAKRQVAELNDSIEVLKKEEKRLRAQVRRLTEKAGVVDVRGKDKL